MHIRTMPSHLQVMQGAHALGGAQERVPVRPSVQSSMVHAIALMARCIAHNNQLLICCRCGLQLQLP